MSMPALTGPILTVADVNEDETGDMVPEDADLKADVTGIPNFEIPAIVDFQDTNGKSPSKPAKKKRRVVKEDSDEEEVATATIPSLPKPKQSPKPSRKFPSPKPLKKPKTPPQKAVEDTHASDTDPPPSSEEEEPDLDAKTKSKSAEKLFYSQHSATQD